MSKKDWRIATAYDPELQDKAVGLFNTRTKSFAPFGPVRAESLDLVIYVFESVQSGRTRPEIFETFTPRPGDVTLLYYDSDGVDPQSATPGVLPYA